MQRCLGCMRAFGEEFDVCPHCGYIVGAGAASKNYLEPGTVLQNRYTLGKVLGQGGFGITYIAWDNKIGKAVAVKEYMPNAFASRVPGEKSVSCYNTQALAEFRSGLEKTRRETRTLARFNELESVVKVYDCFEENDTAYIVMELLRGKTVKEILTERERLSFDETMRIMTPVLQTLDSMHSVGMIHRDVAPDNIFVCEDGKIKLLDFGAARVTSTSNEKTLSVILKQGYAPKEQYSGRGNQGAWTDVYAVCATMYRMLTGTTLPDSLSRTEDAAPDVAIPDSAKDALRKGLAVEPEKRTQSAGELLWALQKDLPQSSYAIDPRQFLDFEEKQKKRKRLRILLAAVAVILLLAAVAVAVITAIQKPKTTTEPSETETEALPVVTEAKLGLQVDFQKMIEEKISDDMEVIRCSEMDYNGDGKKEAFALVAEQESNRPTDDFGVRLIECWFASEKSCEKICSEKETRWYYNLPTDTVILTDDFIAWSIGMGPGPAGGHMCYYYFTVNKSGEPTALIETSDGTLQRFTAADTDFLYCTSEHMIWKESYFRFDEENCRLVEYGGIPITEKQVESLKYGTTMLQRIKEEGQVIHSIYYREAGIININVQNEDQHYGFHTFTVQNGSLDSFGRSGDGYMNKVFIESNYEGLDENYFAGYFDAFSFTVDVSYPISYPYG